MDDSNIVAVKNREPVGVQYNRTSVNPGASGKECHRSKNNRYEPTLIDTIEPAVSSCQQSGRGDKRRSADTHVYIIDDGDDQTGLK